MLDIVVKNKVSEKDIKLALIESFRTQRVLVVVGDGISENLDLSETDILVHCQELNGDFYMLVSVYPQGKYKVEMADAIFETLSRFLGCDCLVENNHSEDSAEMILYNSNGVKFFVELDEDCLDLGEYSISKKRNFE